MIAGGSQRRNLIEQELLDENSTKLNRAGESAGWLHSSANPRGTPCPLRPKRFGRRHHADSSRRGSRSDGESNQRAKSGMVVTIVREHPAEMVAARIQNFVSSNLHSLRPRGGGSGSSPGRRASSGSGSNGGTGGRLTGARRACVSRVGGSISSGRDSRDVGTKSWLEIRLKRGHLACGRGKEVSLVRTAGLFILIGSAAAFVAAGCTSTANGPNGTTTSTAWHWPWSKPAVASLPSAPLFAPDDPTSLASKTPKPGADLYVATARLYRKNGDLNTAELQSRKGVTATRQPAASHYAHLEDNTGGTFVTPIGSIRKRSSSIQGSLGTSTIADCRIRVAASSTMRRKCSPRRSSCSPKSRCIRTIWLRCWSRCTTRGSFSQLSAVHSPAVASYRIWRRCCIVKATAKHTDPFRPSVNARIRHSSRRTIGPLGLGHQRIGSTPLMANAQTPLARPSVELQIADRRSSSVYRPEPH